MPPIIELTREPINYSGLLERVRSNEAGGVAMFLGTVREMTGGRQTSALDYEGYPEMSRKTMEEIDIEAREKWPIIHSGIIHRLGHLELGEISVAVAVSTPHRRASFEAAAYLIDQLKIRVPIWKKENWADGTSEWVHPGT